MILIIMKFENNNPAYDLLQIDYIKILKNLQLPQYPYFYQNNILQQIKAMENYSINYQLLKPKFFIFRLDILPFLIIYSLLGYCFYTFEDTGNTYIYLRLTFIAFGFLNCLTSIFGHWSRKIQATIQYSKISGPIQQNIIKTSHVFVTQKVPGHDKNYGISELFMQQDENTNEYIYFFYFQQRKFYFDAAINNFYRFKPKLEGQKTQQIINRKVDHSRCDQNILEIPIRAFSQIFKDQIVDPFQFFQLFSILLWALDQNGGYSLFLLAMLLFSAYMISLQRIKTLVGFRSMTLAPHLVKVYRKKTWQSVSTYQLKPGDIILVEAGYQHKKAEYEPISQEELLTKLVPFGSKMPSKIRQNVTKKQDVTSFKAVSCDILLLSGTCVANQAILTGQAIPQIKQCISDSDLSKPFSINTHKQNVLFCGTQVLQINDNLHEQQVKRIAANLNIENLPSKGCLGIVLSTGFDTLKGKLIRKVISNAENLKLQEKDGLWIVLFLLICSLFTSAYVLDQGMGQQQRSKQKLFLRCILIITTVVPPQLPMIMTLTVNNSILQLQKQKIFISEPKKLPLGGKIDTIAFDKTGTLTEDKFIFEGIVDDCDNYKTMKNFVNCRPDNTWVLAGCHSLISVEQKLSGDPIQLMFFEEAKWTYTSKNKQAKKGLQRIVIKKVYPFKSELKRMTTVVDHMPTSGPMTSKVLVKGAPEAVQKLLKNIPDKYAQSYKYYTKQGFRLLALAYKNIGNIPDIPKEQQRQFLERDLTFAGFFICSSPLKQDTLKNIKNLQQAQYKLLIITGDNVLTAIKVGLTLNMGKQPYILENENNKLVLSKGDQNVIIKNLDDFKSHLINQDILVCTSTAKQIDPQYFPYITIFARTSPQDKQLIVKKVKQLTGCGIMFAGDGTNDMGGLRTADVGVAVVGTTTISQSQQKQLQFKQQQKRYNEKMNQLKGNIDMAFAKKIQSMKKLTTDFQQRKRQNMMGSLMDDEVKVGDACFAAPFTSKHSNSIKCVLIILRQSIATLVTTIQTYKILAISSMIQAYSLAEMNLTNLKYSEKQTLVVGLLAAVNLYFFSNAKPLKKISPIRAPHTIFNIWFGISFFGQMAIVIFSNYYALNKIGLKYVPEEDKQLSADLQFKESFLNTVIFLFSAISQSTIFLVNHGGEPHMSSLLKNGKQLKFLVIPMLVCFIMTANIFEDLSSLFSLKFEGIPYQANIEMLIVFGLMVSSTFLLERLCRFGQYKKFVGWF